LSFRGSTLRLTGGQAIVKGLESEGVEVVFGLPGLHVLGLYDALYDSGIRHVLVRHEQSAAFMADAYSRVTGEVGVCIMTTGPGVTNATTAIAEAYCDSSPILVIAGQIPSDLIDKDKGVLHEIKQLPIFNSITKWSKRILEVNEIPLLIHRAFRKLREERPRPIYLEVPCDVLEKAEDVNFSYENGFRNTLSGNSNSICEASNLLLKSKFPVIFAGGGVLRSNATSELIALAESLSAPVITSLMGKGAMPEDHPLSLGCASNREVIGDVLSKADTMLAVGVRFSAMSTWDWTMKVPDNLIHIDIDEKEIGKNYPAKVGIVGDAKLILNRILTKIKSKNKVDRDGWVHYVSKIKSEWESKLLSSHRVEIKALMEVRRELNRDAIIAADPTIPVYWMLKYFPVYHPRTFLYPAGYRSIGFGLPAGIASKIAFPRRQVLCVCGDGGFMMVCQELATAVENGVNLPIIVYNNKGYGVIKYVQKVRYGGRYIGVDLHNPDFAKFAESFGANGVLVESLSQLRESVREALRSDKPTVIDLRIPFEFPKN